MNPTHAAQATFEAELEQLLGLKNVTYKPNLSKEELFREAIQKDRGRVAPGGPSDAQKAFSTRVGLAGPLVYSTVPECWGRRV
jgi:phosphoenolpyruvate carboxykinase (ATP)